MKQNTTSSEEKLRQVREEFHQEWVHLQVVGRELTADEQRRSQTLGKVLRFLDEALNALGD